MTYEHPPAHRRIVEIRWTAFWCIAASFWLMAWIALGKLERIAVSLHRLESNVEARVPVFKFPVEKK